jgi:hypothetical protein
MEVIMTVKSDVNFGQEEYKAIVDTARWVGGTMIFLTAVVTAILIGLSQ